MSEFMNKPVQHEWTEENIIQEFEQCHDKKQVARIWGITVKEVGEIIKRK